MNQRDLIAKAIKYELSDKEQSGQSSTLNEVLDFYCHLRGHFKVSMSYGHNLFNLTDFQEYTKKEHALIAWLKDQNIVYFINNAEIFFLNEEDASAFKLRWL